MHLAHPAFTTTGKKKGKVKFASAEAKAKAMKLDEEWRALNKKWDAEIAEKKRQRGLTAPVLKPKTVQPYRRETAHIPSLPFTAGACTKAPDKVYTGDKIVGIGTLHKSNAVPVFSNDEAIEISKMRR